MMRLLERLPVFAADQRGAVAMLFGFILGPALLMVGSAVDFSMVARNKDDLKAAADMATLGALRTYIKLVGPTSPDSAKQDAIAKAIQAGRALFEANLDRVPSKAVSGASNPKPTIDFKFVTSGDVVKATGNFTGSSPAFIMKVAGFQTIPIQGSVEAQGPVIASKNIFLLVDTSQSMGIGGTLDEMKRLEKAAGCFFGCHNKRAQYWWEPIYYDVAKKNNIWMRIDYARAAVRKMIDNASASGNRNNLKFAIYKMHHESLDVGVPLTADYARLRSAADAIDTTDVAYLYYTYGETYFEPALASLSRIISSSSANGSTNYVFIITDGLLDTACPGWGDRHCTGTLDPGWCQRFKDNGVIVGVLYTTYVKFRGLFQKDDDVSYDAYVAPVIDRVAPDLKSCASPGFFFEAQDGPAIQSKMDEMFNKATLAVNLRLSQ